MLDKNCVLGWEDVEHDLYKEGHYIFGVELDLFNGHKSYYCKTVTNGTETIEYFLEDVYEAIDRFNEILLQREKSITKLKDILPNYPINNIEVRTNDPFGDDMLFGYCHWTGTELISGDGDYYSLDEIITKYEFNEEKHKLTYWILSEWE